MKFERGNKPIESMNVGRKSLAQEIDQVYKRGPTLPHPIHPGQYVNELWKIDVATVPHLLRQIQEGSIDIEDYCFDIPEEPEYEGSRTLRFFKDYKGKWLKYKRVYYKIPNEFRKK